MTRHLIWKASLNWSYKEMGEISQLQNWSKTKDEWKTISDDKEGAAWIKPPKRIQFHKASTEAEGRMGLEWFSVFFRPFPRFSPPIGCLFNNWHIQHLKRKMEAEESIHRRSVNCLNYIPVKILSAFWRGNIVSTSEPWSVEHLKPTRWGKSQPPGQLIIC